MLEGEGCSASLKPARPLNHESHWSAKEAEPANYNLTHWVRSLLITKMADDLVNKQAPFSENGSEDSERSSIRNG